MNDKPKSTRCSECGDPCSPCAQLCRRCEDDRRRQISRAPRLVMCPHCPADAPPHPFFAKGLCEKHYYAQRAASRHAEHAASSKRYRERHPDRRKETQRTYNEDNREAKQQHGRMILRIAGAIPQEKARKHLASNWRGGRIMPCCVPGCDKLAGWRHPFEIKKNKTGFYCSDHAKTRLRRGRVAHCAVCGRSVGFMPPSRWKLNSTGFRCPPHTNVRLPKKELENDERQDTSIRSCVA